MRCVIPLLLWLVSLQPAFAALSPTNLTAGGSNTAATSYTTASITPSANALVLASVYNNADPLVPNTPTLTGNGLTWVEVVTRLDGVTNTRITLFRAMGSAPSAGAVTIDMAGQSQANGSTWIVTEFSGADTSGTNGSAAVIQGAGAGCVFGSTLTVTLGAFSSAANATYGAIVITGIKDIVPGSGFTQIRELQDTQPPGTISVQDEWKSTNDTSVDWTWSGSHCNYAVAAELKPGCIPSLTLLGVTAC